MNEEEQDFGPRLGQVLDEYVRDFPPPATDLVTGGMTRGRRLRRRRQAQWGAAGLTLGVGLVGGVLFGGLRGEGAGGTTAAGSESAVTIPEFSLAASRTSAPAGKTALTGEAAVKTLKDLLPGDPATGGYRWWDGDKQDSGLPVEAGGRLLMTADGGQAEVAVSVQGGFQLTTVEALSKEEAREAAGSTPEETDKSGRTAPDKSTAKEAAKGAGKDEGKKPRQADEKDLKKFYSCQERRDPGLRQTSCSARNLDDGSVQIAYEDTDGTFVRRTADVLRKDGTRIVITVSNGTDNKHGPARVEEPPLTMEQITQAATSEKWQPWVVSK
ncbi:hypothetical protein AB0I00_17760 [Streptomyces sp. NPDC050803]|uniref:hypothetical protein n=1 Tax=unclassified Streptomyces TaxID=2593676 RepID=UPI00344050A9